MKKILIPSAALLAMAGCSQQSTSTSESTENASENEVVIVEEVGLPENFFSAESTGSVDIHEARHGARTGDPVTLTGYIGGRPEPFTEGRAVFVIADTEEAPACTDGCPIPWDACCTPGDVVADNSVTVQVVDEDGFPLKLGLNGEGGLEPGAVVSVSGNVREASEDIFIVDASSVSIISTPE